MYKNVKHLSLSCIYLDIFRVCSLYRHAATSLPHLDATPGSRHGDAYGDRLGAGTSLNESDGSFYIRKIESLQERLGAMATRKTTLGETKIDT